MGVGWKVSWRIMKLEKRIKNDPCRRTSREVLAIQILQMATELS